MTTPIRRLTYALVLLVAGAFAVVHIKGPRGIASLQEKRRMIRELEEGNQALRADNERRQLRNADLKNKPDAWDLEIRKRMEKLRKGETTFRLPPEGPGDAPPEETPAEP